MTVEVALEARRWRQARLWVAVLAMSGVAAIGAMQPMGALAGAIVLIVTVTYMADRRFLLLPLFLWFVAENSVIAILESWGLAPYTVWLRRSDEVILVALALATLYRQLLSQGRVRGYGIIPPVLSLLLVSGLTALHVGHAPTFVAGVDLVLLLKSAIVFGVLGSVGDDVRPLPTRKIANWIIGIGLCAAAIACVETVDPSAFRAVVGLPTQLYLRGTWSSLQGPFVNPGLFGWYMAVCVIVSVALAMETKGSRLLLVAPFLLGILASGRRKPLAGALIGVLVLIWLASPRQVRWKRLGWAALAAAVLVVGFWPFVNELVIATLRDYILTRNPYAQARIVLYAASVSLAVRHFPLGAGPGLFGGFAARLYYSPLYTQMGLNHVWGLSPQNPTFLDDTFWPHVLGEFGVLGLAAYSWFLVRVWRRSLEAARRGSPGTALMARIGLALLAEGLVESLASAGFEQSLSALVMFGGAALAVGAAAAERRQGVKGASPGASLAGVRN